MFTTKCLELISSKFLCFFAMKLSGCAQHTAVHIVIAIGKLDFLLIANVEVKITQAFDSL